MYEPKGLAHKIFQVCSRCSQEFELNSDNFYKNKSTKTGWGCYCKSCIKEYRRDRPKYVDPDDPTRVNYHRKRLFGLSKEEVDQIKKAQDGVCAICKSVAKNKDGSPRELCLDHDHETGTIRGMLCQHCNAGLGQFKDSPYLLEKAILYLGGYDV